MIMLDIRLKAQLKPQELVRVPLLHIYVMNQILMDYCSVLIVFKFNKILLKFPYTDFLPIRLRFFWSLLSPN